MNVASGAIEDLSAEAGLAPGFEGYPDWSPDGTKLAFSAQAHLGGPIDILVYDLASRSTQDLTADLSNDLRPRWSPDGTKIALGGGGSAGGLDVYTVNADGSELTRLTSAPGWQWEPVWSPDGRQIAFTSYPNETTDIYVMNADGSHARDVSNTRTTNDSQPSWSDGGIAFRSDRTGIDGIYLMNGNGSNVHRLSSRRAYDEDPGWSRDGKQLVFTSGREAHSTITIAGMDGGAPRTLTSGQWFDVDPAWSPTGSRLAFTRSPVRTRSDIYVVDADGAGARNLTRGRGLHWSPSWSPDGAQIVYEKDEFFGHDTDLYTVNADGGAEMLLSGLDWPQDTPAFQPSHS